MSHVHSQITRKQCCELCNKDDKEDMLMLCDGCDTGCVGEACSWPGASQPRLLTRRRRRWRRCHTFCLKPPLKCIPEGDWFCPECSDAEKEADAGGLKTGEVSGCIRSKPGSK